MQGRRMNLEGVEFVSKGVELKGPLPADSTYRLDPY